MSVRRFGGETDKYEGRKGERTEGWWREYMEAVLGITGECSWRGDLDGGKWDEVDRSGSVIGKANGGAAR